MKECWNCKHWETYGNGTRKDRDEYSSCSAIVANDGIKCELGNHDGFAYVEIETAGSFGCNKWQSAFHPRTRK